MTPVLRLQRCNQTANLTVAQTEMFRHDGNGHARIGLEQNEQLIFRRFDMLLHIDVFQRFKNHFEHELDEYGCAALCVGGVQGGIIVGLMLQNHGFNRQIGEDRLPFAQNQRLPKSPCSAVSIRKRMDELKLIMKDAGSDERMRSRVSQPFKELLHGFRDILGGRTGMNELIPCINADTCIAECTCAHDKPIHHNAMDFEQIVDGVRIERRKQIVSPKSILHFPHFLLRGENALTVQQRSHLIERQAVMLNRQRRMNGTDAVGAMQLRLSRQIAAYRDFLDRRCNFGGKAEDCVRQLIGRGIGTHCWIPLRDRFMFADNEFMGMRAVPIDEWLLYPLKETEARDLLEIVESRYKRNSTIFCSQFDIPGWPEKLSDPLLADAICDRIVHDAYTVVIGGKESMRKRKGLQDI